jgi:electron transfer flavoprotein alpha subunit
LDDLGRAGAAKVMSLEGASGISQDAGLMAAAVVKAAESVNADLVVFSHDISGKAIAPRVAVRMNAGFVPGAIDYPNTDGGAFSVRKNVFSGKASALYEIRTAKKVISLLPNTFQVKLEGQAVGAESFQAGLGASRIRVKETKVVSGELSLPEAETVVSAGRGMKGPEHWGMIEDLAKQLGAATACSRPVSDIGWRPHHEHVGQTGLAIRPNLYFAIGISGAIQHLAGVNGSKTIVVINKDPEAPFFKSADYGIVGDAFEVVPKLIEAVKKFKAGQH